MVDVIFVLHISQDSRSFGCYFVRLVSVYLIAIIFQNLTRR